MFIEVDYVEYTDETGLHTWKMSDAVIAKLEQLYGSLGNLNPDGTTGINLHIFQDTVLPKDTPCWDRNVWLPHQAPFKSRHRDGFRYAAICNGGDAGGQIGGTSLFFVQTLDLNNDPSDDQTEFWQFMLYARFAHELGHTLGFSMEGMRRSIGSRTIQVS